MLRLDPNNIEAFLEKYSAQLMTCIAYYIPSILVEETDDIYEFINRILYNARKNGGFNRTFGHKSQPLEVNDSDIEAYVINILTSSKDVTLKRIITERHVSITPTGEFKPFMVEIPQITISWQRQNDEFHCILKYPNGDMEKNTIMVDIKNTFVEGVFLINL